MTYSEKSEPKEMKTVERVKLTELCELNMGQSPDSKSYNVVGKGLPFYQGNADFGTLHPSPRVWCALPQKTARKDDVLLSVRAPVGAVNIATETCCIGRGLAALKARPERSCPLFLYYAMTAKARELVEKSTGSTFKAVNRKVLEELEIPVYSLAEQEQIVAKLQLTDRLIAAHKQQLLKLDELVKSQFIEMFGDPVINTKGLPTQKGEKLFTLSNGKFVPEEKRLSDGIPAYGGNGISFFTDDYLFGKNTIIIGRVGFQSGNVHLAQGPLWITDNAMYISEYNDDVMDLLFLFSLMKYIDFTRFQDAGDLKKVTQKPFMAMEFIQPPLSKQLQYTDFVKHTDNSKFAIRQSLEQLNLLKSSLMQKYFAA